MNCDAISYEIHNKEMYLIVCLKRYYSDQFAHLGFSSGLSGVTGACHFTYAMIGLPLKVFVDLTLVDTSKAYCKTGVAPSD